MFLTSIVRFLPVQKDQSFNPDDIAAMSAAYDETAAKIRAQKQPAIVLEVIADRIISLYSEGERDPARITNRVLESLGILTE